jgi:cytochrome c oxidase cbb3-type subunit 3
VPALADGNWLYGSGRPAEIERTVTYGIRSHHPKAWNLASMPAYAQARPSPTQTLPPLTPGQVDDIVAYLAGLNAQPADPAASARGSVLFRGAAGCYDCHAPDARGDSAVGAPALTGRAPLYGDGSEAAVAQSITAGRAGVCPAWSGRLAQASIRAVALYVYSLSHKSDAVASR